MKKMLFILVALASGVTYAQVGVGNTDPKATLDVNKSSYLAGEQAGIAVTQLTATQIEGMNTTGLKSGTLVYATTDSGSTINAIGYWYYNGTSWIRNIGATGAQGIQGIAGTNGKTILNGTSNPVAATGTDGDFYINSTSNTLFGPKASGSWPSIGTSLVGPQGATGAQGIQGLTGAVGATGAQGIAGAVGATGAQGIQGIAGTNGKTILNGTSNPVAATGTDGDFYINSTSNTLFGPKASGSWPSIGTSLVGPQGATGAQGIQGLTGAVGATGAQGIQGIVHIPVILTTQFQFKVST
jgi:hypothetical protein